MSYTARDLVLPTLAPTNSYRKETHSQDPLAAIYGDCAERNGSKNIEDKRLQRERQMGGKESDAKASEYLWSGSIWAGLVWSGLGIGPHPPCGKRPRTHLHTICENRSRNSFSIQGFL